MTFRNSLRLVRVKADLKWFGFHDLRHYFASMCVMNGLDFMTTAAWLGHKDGGVLIGKVYGHLLDEHRHQSAARLQFGIGALRAANRFNARQSKCLTRCADWIRNVSTRVIKESFLKEAAKEHSRAAEGLATWIAMVRAGKWKNPVEMKRAAPEVDPVRVKSRRTVYVFNIRSNEFHLIAAVHFNRQLVYTLRFLAHAEYDKAHWKNEL